VRRFSCKHTHVTRFIHRAAPLLSTDVTGGYTQLNIQGPRSRELLQALTDTDMGNEAFPFRACREIAIGLARVNVARITYVGELG
jgi:glycine cleavage system aminomethyltransferase T